MAKKAPGKSHREGLTIVQLMDMFPTEKAATEWFESVIWPDGRHCPKCGSLRTREASHKYMPYWCTDCRSYFSVKTGTAMQASKIPMRKWAIAIYLCLTSLKSVSSMKLKRDIGVSQPTAWFMMQRIREAWGGEGEGPFGGPVEIDETYFGGKRKNMPKSKRKELAGTGRGAVGKTAVVGAKDRDTNKVAAQVVEATDSATLHDFVADNAKPGAVVYTDDAAAYEGIPNPHGTVKHSVNEYVNGMAHTNGIESFWSMLKRAHKGTFHKISPKHLQRYVSEFAGKHNVRDSGTLVQMPRYRRPARRSQPSLPRPHRRQRAFVGFRGVTAPRGGTRRAPASPAWRPQGPLSDQAWVCRSLHGPPGAHPVSQQRYAPLGVFEFTDDPLYPRQRPATDEGQEVQERRTLMGDPKAPFRQPRPPALSRMNAAPAAPSRHSRRVLAALSSSIVASFSAAISSSVIVPVSHCSRGPPGAVPR